MESLRWLRLAPLALAVVAGSVGPGRAVVGASADPPWDPPPCPAASASGPPAASAWYRLDPALDRVGTLTGLRLTLGAAADPGRRLDLAPESFASGPVGGRVLVGEDDGSASHLRLLDPGLGCATAMADEAAVIRSAVIAADGRSTYEHRVDRRTREDLGVWRRSLGDAGRLAGAAERVLPGLPADDAIGPTFVTDLVVEADGRLVVSSCGLEACRVRLLDPATGDVTLLAGSGPALGVAGGRLVVRAACAGYPCAVETVDLATRRRSVLVEDGLAATLAGGFLVYEAPGGRVATVEIATGQRTVPASDGALPVGRGSTATAGAEAPPGWVPLAPGGRPGATTIRALDPRSGSTGTPEVSR